MGFLKKIIKSINEKWKLSFFILIFIGVILIVGYAFLEKHIYIETVAISLFILAVFQVFTLQYFLKNQLKINIIKKNLNARTNELNKALEASDKIADYKSIYLSNMIYEVRRPISTVLGMLDMLKKTNLDITQQAQVEIVEYSSQYLLQLVIILTDNTKVDSGDFTLNLVTMNLRSDLLGLFKVFEYQAWEKGLEFEYNFLDVEKDRFQVLADSSKIQQVLINLVNNAIKFTYSGKISVTVDQTVGIDDNQIVAFYIKDTGIGMTQEAVKTIFNKSVEPDVNAMMKDYSGGGIGLLISYQLVKHMGGELKIESKENEGTTFYFSLQLKKTLNLRAKEDAYNPILLDKFNVLVAEDNQMSQKVIKFLLERQGAQCTFAKNGLEALELYKILDFDMIFMDIYMPDMDGYQATKFIKETDKFSLKHTPIIAVSASAFEEDIYKAKLSGIDDFLAKPIEVVKLRELLKKYSKTGT